MFSVRYDEGEIVSEESDDDERESYGLASVIVSEFKKRRVSAYNGLVIPCDIICKTKECFLFEFLGDTSLEISMVIPVLIYNFNMYLIHKIKEEILNIIDYLWCFDIAD